MIGRRLEYSETLPSSWSVRNVGDIGSYLNGFAFKAEHWRSDGLPIIRIQNLNNANKSFNYYSGEVPKKYLIKNGDILISWSASLGTYRWNRGDAWLNQHIFKATPILDEVTDEFFYWVMVHAIERIADNARGSTMKHVTGKEFKNSEVALPPFADQKKIAHILSTVQRAIEAQERIIQTTTELKKVLMQKLFTEGLHNEPQKQTEIGLVPESWEVVRIGDCCDVSTGTTPSTKIPEYYIGNNPFIKTGEITNNRIFGASVYISDEAIVKYNLKIYEPGTLLIAMYGQGKTRGQISILEVPASTSQNAGAIAPNSEVDSEYLWCYLMSQYDQLRRSGIEGHISHLNLGYVKQILFPKPSLSDQQKIASTFRGLDRKILLHQRKQRALQDLFRTLLHELMTAKIRVHDIKLPKALQIS